LEFAWDGRSWPSPLFYPKEDKRRAVAQRAAEIAERRAVFDANNNKN